MIESEIIYAKEQYEEYCSERFIYGEELLKLRSYHTANKECIKIIYGYNIRDFKFNLGGQKDCPLFIDGLDEMQNPNEILHYISKKDYDRVVCTSRFNVPFEIDFTHIITRYK